MYEHCRVKGGGGRGETHGCGNIGNMKFILSTSFLACHKKKIGGGGELNCSFVPGAVVSSHACVYGTEDSFGFTTSD